MHVTNVNTLWPSNAYCVQLYLIDSAKQKHLRVQNQQLWDVVSTCCNPVSEYKKLTLNTSEIGGEEATTTLDLPG
jgi:hypothetical protein